MDVCCCSVLEVKMNIFIQKSLHILNCYFFLAYLFLKQFWNWSIKLVFFRGMGLGVLLGWNVWFDVLFKNFYKNKRFLTSSLSHTIYNFNLENFFKSIKIYKHFVEIRNIPNYFSLNNLLLLRISYSNILGHIRLITYFQRYK